MNLKFCYWVLLMLLLFTACHSPRERQNVQQTTAKVADLKEADSLEDSVKQPDIWMQKAQRGIDFVAMGNEPSWSLEIDFEKSMIFTSLNEPDTVVTPVPAGMQSTRVSVTNYSAETENGTLSISISEEACTDAMSGEEFEYTVTVLARSAGMANATEFSGCGRYLSENPLHGAWQLESMGGQDAASVFGEAKPYLVIQINEKKVTGKGGCNRLSGTIDVKSESIIFSPLAATKMACPNMEAEQQFIKAITDQEVAFQLGGEIMTLKTQTGQLTLKRMREIPKN